MTADVAAQQASGTVRSNRSALAAGAAILAFLGANIAWILLDQGVWPWDQAWYGEVTLDLWFARSKGFEAWFSAMLHAIPSKPPLLTWLVQVLLPLTRLSFEVEPVLLLGNVLFAAGTLWLVYLVARELRAGATEALVAVVLCASAPLFIAFTHEFMVEELQALVVAAMLLFALRAPELPLWRVVGLCLLLTALGFLTKTTSELFLLPFTVYLILAILIVRQRRRRGGAGLLEAAIFLAAAVTIVATVAWYRTNWPSLVQHFTDATSNEVAQYYGSPVILATKLRYWTSSLAAAISPFASLAALIFVVSAAGIAMGLFAIVKKPLTAFFAALIEDGLLFALAAAGTIAATILAYSLQVNEEPRFLVPLFPLIAVLLAWSLSALRRKMISGFVLLAVLANAALSCTFMFGLNPLGVPPALWLRTIQRNGDDKAVLTNVVGSTCNQTIANRYTIIGVEYVELNAQSASFYSAKQRRLYGYRCYYSSLGYAETSTDQALRHIDKVSPDYIATVVPDKQRAPDFLNVVSRPVAELIARDPHFVLAPGSGGYVLIYRRLR